MISNKEDSGGKEKYRHSNYCKRTLIRYKDERDERRGGEEKITRKQTGTRRSQQSSGGHTDE